MTDPQQRRDELSAGLARTRERVAQACALAHRDPADVTVVVVTKTWPATDVLALADLGVANVGENKSAELIEKRDACAQADLTWHFIGQLQSNKARDVARAADVVHSIDRPKLVTALSRAREDAQRPLECLIQVSLDPEPMPGRGGVDARDVGELAESISGAPGVNLRGVMGVAPLEGDAKAAFDRLREVHDRLVHEYPDATWMSAGMSHDLAEAIAAGATHLRVGSAILGSRAYLR